MPEEEALELHDGPAASCHHCLLEPVRLHLETLTERRFEIFPGRHRLRRLGLIVRLSRLRQVRPHLALLIPDLRLQFGRRHEPELTRTEVEAAAALLIQPA